jgi:hypothetical protein
LAIALDNVVDILSINAYNQHKRLNVEEMSR